MSNILDTIVTVCVKDTLSLMRHRPYLQWEPDSYWWASIQTVWTNPFYLRHSHGSAISVNQLNKSLADLGLPASAIKPFGKYTLAEFDNISFVYQNKTYKDGRVDFKIAPHIKGLKFKDCGHSFVSPDVDPDALALFMITISASIPAVRKACAAACQDGLKERKIREIKLQTANSFLSDFFKGELPKEIVSCEIADSTPGAMDLIRLKLHYDGRPSWDYQYLDIPFDDRKPEYLANAFPQRQL